MIELSVLHVLDKENELVVHREGAHVHGRLAKELSFTVIHDIGGCFVVDIEDRNNECLQAFSKWSGPVQGQSLPTATTGVDPLHLWGRAGTARGRST
jgi:hypothetical protein